jgi:hypothetical protein
MAISQVLIWTALPNGVETNPNFPNSLRISVFVGPQLSSGLGNAPLSAYPDFSNWPETISGGEGISFDVVFKNGATVAAVLDPNMPGLDPRSWDAVFNSLPAYPTNVKDYQYTDMSTATPASFGSASAQSYIEGLYSSIGYNSPSSPPVMSFNSGRTPTVTPKSLLTQVEEVVGIQYKQSLPVLEAVDYYASRTLPQSLDFHETVSGFGSYPTIVRIFGLVFDLIIPIPAGVTGSTTVKVVPSFTSKAGSVGGTNLNVSLPTACTVGGGVFQTGIQPGTVDYTNGMLDLADTSRFSVTTLDVDGASMRMATTTQAMASVIGFEDDLGVLSQGETISVPLPAIRSTGAAVVYTNFATALMKQLKRQTQIAGAVQTYISTKSTSALNAAPFPLYAGDIMRGHRFDVYTASDPNPAWQSLHQRYGSYSFGPGAGASTPNYTIADEGFTSHSASQAVPAPSSPTLYIHEEICRWRGWSLNAPRYGGALSAADGTGQANDVTVLNPGNPADATPDGNGFVSPQFSASFTVPTTNTDTTYLPAVETVGTGTLPKLRFGNEYQIRARGVDLAGNGLQLSSADASTATPTFTHYRYQTVAPPVLAPTAPYSPGQAVLVMAILNDMVDTPANNARWLFPPKVGQLLAEEHGMFDVAAVGDAPSAGAVVSGSLSTYQSINRMDTYNIQELGASYGAPDPNWTGGDGAWYFPLTGVDAVTQLPAPWMSDPMTLGAMLLNLPGLPASNPYGPILWLGAGESWPNLQPFMLQLAPAAASAPTVSLTPPTSTSSAVVTTSIPPGAVYDVRISSLLNPPEPANPAAPNYTDLGVYQWILKTLYATVPASGQAAAVQELDNLAELGLLWTLSPYVTLRLVHATRTPIAEPLFEKLTMVTPRTYGSTTADLFDTAFSFDAGSTSSIDVEANWTDFVDDPTDILNQPGVSTVTTAGSAFQVTVPDPNAQEATDHPGFVVHEPQDFALTSSPGLTHDLGDTRHHLVTYIPVGTSRFAEFFRPARPIPPTEFVDTTPVQAPGSFFGINPGSVILTDADGNVVDPSEYVVNYLAGTIALVTAPSSPVEYQIDYEPIVTLPQPPPPGELWPQAFGTQVHILSSARPATPKIDRVVPAWQISSEGTVSSGKPLNFARGGGWLRVWLDRPWYSSGDGEMLGVVCLPKNVATTQPPTDPAYHITTLLGLDPISVADPTLVTSTTPNKFGGLATIPSPIVGRPGYANPPLLHLLEDNSGTEYAVYPFEVTYDTTSQQWYADVQIAWASGQEPPPGYFVRLACVRFQPYSCADAEVSPVALATFTQPVSNRAVSVVNVPEQQSVRVTVEGPSYQGYRPADAQGDNGPTIEDTLNDYWLHPYSDFQGTPVPSTIVVEVQVQDTTVFSGDLAWQVLPGSSPVMLEPFMQGSLTLWSGSIELPYAIGQGPYAMRLRVSEIDYYTVEEPPITAPAAVDTSFRRPFVCHIPIQ